MTDPTRTHVTMLLDRSGSMQSIKRDIEGGYNAFIADQKVLPGECTVTLAQFDAPNRYQPTAHSTYRLPTHSEDWYKEVYAGLPVAQVPPLVLEPRGGTALLDALGKAITDTGAYLAAIPEADRPGTVIFGIVTDGQENSSVEWTHPAVKALIEQQEKQYGWSFLYLGANQDAVEEAGKFGVAADRAMTYAGANAAGALGSYSASVSMMRGAAAAGASPDEVRTLGGYTDEQREKAVR